MSFQDLQVDESKVVEKDTLGGGFRIFPSDVYDWKIKAAYRIDSKSSKSFGMHFDLVKANGETYREDIYMANAQGSITNDKGEYSRGFMLVNSIALLAVGTAINKLNSQKKTIQVYNFQEKKEVPVDVDMFMDFIGKDITLAIQEIIENKTVKDPNGGRKYLPTNEKRNTNKISKAFRTSNGMTVEEMRKKKADASFEPTFKAQWLERNKDKPWDQFRPVTNQGEAGAPAGNFAGGSNPDSSLASDDDAFNF